MNELELILTDIFNCSRLDLYSNHSFVLKENELSRLDKILKNRARHTPLQYLLGYAEFMGLRFKVNKDVFIPRPETEILVEVVIKKLQTTNYKLPASPSGKQTTKIMDIGTGSGCIAVSLARFLEDVHIVAVDISKEALRVACENAKLHNVEEKVSLLEGDFFRLIEARHYFNGGRISLILSFPIRRMCLLQKSACLIKRLIMNLESP
jgi:release factor glutamine methyltransferase